MNVVAHVLFPVAFAQSANVCRTRSGGGTLFNWKALLIIGICGALPDILSPHTSLDARYSSFSHSIWFLLPAFFAVLFFSIRFPSLRFFLFCCYFATALHVFCDLIAGGINVYGPFGRKIVGQYWVSFRHWIALDITAALFCLVSFLFVKKGRFALYGAYAAATLCSVLVVTYVDSERVLLKHTTAADADPAGIERARLVWDSLYGKWRSGSYEAVSGEFNDEMRRALTPQLQKSLFEQLSRSYGICQGVALVEKVSGRFGFPRMCIYRFRGSFSGTRLQPEIGILFDSEGKVSGFRFSRTVARTLF
jgi:hypothetical protein